MKRLGLLRHAKSDWDDLSLRDFDRGLNDRGRRGAKLMGDYIREYGANWDMAIASPAERVKRTLDASELDLPVTFDEKAYLADASTLMTLVSRHAGNSDAVLVIAHNPGMQELALNLVAHEDENDLFHNVMRKYPTAAFAMFELEIEDWSDLAPECGRLVHFARPRDLDANLGPQTMG
ncbi:SixA phosphatase family protein [Aurantiacibacter sp. D1-12]|uniref:SixA phosphatase family protein n=1 Tax=Aurantiacibacter sp. D1-12 TaxID=2993658 RepID=UPI00237CF604|nr:histidine phosphatase family protein [Aurantiacibacter sp. D1-12]MDE1466383.1 histidine phosphatase family protein [Aurantiacibacter sp. D1-12]